MERNEANCACSADVTERSIENNAERSDAVRVLKTCNGHINGVMRMIEEGRYCIDIANQLVAVEALVKKANKLILTQHLQHCVVEAAREGQAQEKADEIVAILNKLLA